MLIEDVACPVENLGAMTMDLVEMFQKYGYDDASCFGHALEGNLHLVFSQVRAWCSARCSSCNLVDCAVPVSHLAAALGPCKLSTA